MNVFLPGQYPRSEQLVNATRDFDRNRISAAALQFALQDDVSALKSIQWGLPYVSTGLFNWQDLLRPYTELIDGAHAESLKRFYATNTFWRILEAPLKFLIRDKTLDAWFNTYFLAQGAFQKDDPIIINIPFPFVFREYSKNLTLEQIGGILEITAQQIKECPNAAVCLIDPSFGWSPLSDDDKQFGRRFVEKLRSSIPHTPIYLMTFFFSIENDIDYLYQLPVDGFGIDFYNNSLSAILKKFPSNKTLLAGVINTESTLLESAEHISHLMDRVNSTLSTSQILFTPNGPAELLPRDVMNKKVKHLQEVIACLPHHS